MRSREAGAPDPGFARGQAWLAAAETPNLDFVARRARARAATATMAERAALTAAIFGHQNADGGFGAAAGYESDAFDTGLALAALHELQAPADARVRRAFIALEALRSPEGAWALVPGREVSTVATAQVLIALQAWPDVPEASALRLTSAGGAARAGRTTDGGFGESPSTAHATALALLALDRLSAPAGVADAATAWLHGTQAQDRSWDGRTYETALAIKALKGRTAPNLVIRQDGLTLSPTHAEEGDVVTVTVRVRNDGRLSSPATTVRLYDGAPVAANAMGEVAVEGLAPATSAVVTILFDTQGRAGTRVLTALADPDRAISEVREDDNAASRSLVVEGPQADLVVTPVDVVVSPYPPETAEPVDVAVSVRNQGERESPPFEVRLVRGAATIGTATAGPLAAGASTVVGIPWAAPLAAGTVQLTAVADAQFAVPESDETNNAASIAVEVTPPGGKGPDLEVPLVAVDPAALSTIPQTFDVRAVVRNLGRDPLTSTIAIFDGAPETGTLLVEQPISLDGRSSTVIAVPFEIVSPGDRTLTVVVDRAGTVEETDEDNNRASVSIDDPGNTFDVAVESATASPESVVVGQAVSVLAVVRNRGTTRITDIPVILDLAAAGEVARVLVTLEPGAAASVTLPWVTSVTGSPVAITVMADPFGLLLELDEVNNRRAVPLVVQSSALSNLRVSGADVSFTPDPPLQGGSSVVAALVRNPSPGGSGAVRRALLPGRPGRGRCRHR